MNFLKQIEFYFVRLRSLLMLIGIFFVIGFSFGTPVSAQYKKIQAPKTLEVPPQTTSMKIGTPFSLTGGLYVAGGLLEYSRNPYFVIVEPYAFTQDEYLIIFLPHHLESPGRGVAQIFHASLIPGSGELMLTKLYIKSNGIIAFESQVQRDTRAPGVEYLIISPNDGEGRDYFLYGQHSMVGEDIWGFRMARQQSPKITAPVDGVLGGLRGGKALTMINGKRMQSRGQSYKLTELNGLLGGFYGVQLVNLHRMRKTYTSSSRYLKLFCFIDGLYRDQPGIMEFVPRPMQRGLFDVVYQDTLDLSTGTISTFLNEFLTND